jgi:hypothetical protein
LATFFIICFIFSFIWLAFIQCLILVSSVKFFLSSFNSWGHNDFVPKIFSNFIFT